MKKILIVMESLIGGGAEKVLIDILTNFDYSEYSVTLFLIYNEGPYLNDLPENVKTIHLFNTSKSVLNILFFKILRYFYFDSVVRFILKRKILDEFDSTISFMEGKSLRIHSYIRGISVKNITWVHIDLNSLHWSKSFFVNDRHEEEVYNKMDNIIFVSRKALNEFNLLFNVNVNQEVVYNLIDKEFINKQVSKSLSYEKFTICCVGRVCAQKSFDRVIRLAKRLKDHKYSVDFLIIGEGPLKEKLISMCKQYDIEDMVHFLGFVKPPYNIMASSDLFLSTSYTEGYPLVICEALCLGLPIVATRVTGSEEILGDSEFGIITEQTDISIYEGVKKIIDSPDLLIYYKDKSIERAKMFSKSETLNTIYNII